MPHMACTRTHAAPCVHRCGRRARRKQWHSTRRVPSAAVCTSVRRMETHARARALQTNGGTERRATEKCPFQWIMSAVDRHSYVSRNSGRNRRGTHAVYCQTLSRITPPNTDFFPKIERREARFCHSSEFNFQQRSIHAHYI